MTFSFFLTLDFMILNKQLVKFFVFMLISYSFKKLFITFKKSFDFKLNTYEYTMSFNHIVKQNNIFSLWPGKAKIPIICQKNRRLFFMTAFTPAKINSVNKLSAPKKSLTMLVKWEHNNIYLMAVALMSGLALHCDKVTIESVVIIKLTIMDRFKLWDPSGVYAEL